jgi:cytochrome c biogenesis protein CcdA
MELLIPSFFAGFLTVLAPCVITLLPIILGGSLTGKNKWRPLVIVLSLSVSVFVFTLLLKATTAFITIPDAFWRYLAGGLILFFALTLLFPAAWTKLAFKLGLFKSEKLVEKSGKKEGFTGAILLGASLGPVFTTCSPTYAIILAVVFPSSFFVGVTNLLVYIVGMMIPLLLIGYGGQRVAMKFRGAANPKGWFKRTIGVVLLLVGLTVITGFDKKIESAILDTGYQGPIQLEQSLMGDVQDEVVE